MSRKDYEREVRLLAELASLAMKGKDKDYGKALKYLEDAKLAIENARKMPR